MFFSNNLNTNRDYYLVTSEEKYM